MIKGISQHDKGYSLMKSVYFLRQIKSEILQISNYQTVTKSAVFSRISAKIF